MNYNESNFIYLKTTIMGKYYDELVKAECICEYFPMITKIIVRKVLEGVLKDIAEKYNIESSISVWNLFDNIKFNPNILLPGEICNYIKIVLVNGYEYASSNNKNKGNYMTSIGVLEIIHNILCWYLKKTEPQKMILTDELKFKAPSTIEYVQEEINKIKEDILLKYNQINNLRQKIIELSDQSKNVSELNKIIIAIKEEVAYLEATKELLTKKMQVQKDQVSYIEKNYKTYIKRFKELQEKCNENQKFIFNKESQLVKAEVQKQELKDLDKELYEKDESIRRSEVILEDELKIIRKAYERLTDLTAKYQDILETVEFSYDKDLQKILELQKNNVEMKINFEDRIFSKNITNYSKNISETRRKIIIFKEMLNEKIKKEIRYPLFYRGFLRLEDTQLKIIYTIITNANTKFNLISKSKEFLLKSSEDKFLESINKNLEELKNINNDEIKLVLYYKLVKLAQVPLGNIYNRREFIRTLDNIVDKAYEVLMTKKDFKGGIRKLDAISVYYLEKAILDLKSKNSNVKINEYFMILPFLSNRGSSLNQKQQEELLPLLVMLIISIDVIEDSESINLENYNRMVDIWKHKQEKYNDISIEKKDKESELESFIKEKQRLEINYKKVSKKECRVFADLKSKIEKTIQIKDKEKENLKNIHLLINNKKMKISELQKQLNNIKNVYIDIEEGYY